MSDGAQFKCLDVLVSGRRRGDATARTKNNTVDWLHSSGTLCIVRSNILYRTFQSEGIQ
jgi:hypothetical protein